MNVLKTSLLATALIAAGISSANAATETANFGVQLVVQNACTITAASGANAMDFGTVTSDITANIDVSTALTVNCSKGASYSIGLNDGLNVTGTQRRMANGTQYVEYDLYRDSGYTQAWGALASINEFGGTGTGTDQAVPVYGRVPAGQVIGTAGTYNDTVMATIEF